MCYSFHIGGILDYFHILKCALSRGSFRHLIFEVVWYIISIGVCDNDDFNDIIVQHLGTIGSFNSTSYHVRGELSNIK